MSTWDKINAQFLWIFENTKNVAGWVFAHSRQIGWFIVTTGMITAFPLIFEVKREELVEELEQLRIAQGVAQGRSPQELANSGLTAAVDPKVLTN
eukprot:CAMPEP_0173150782 /NCGR_PEP_ID=MMETSP1105-20130129/11173_1 /TAXON_ID=2985 /ORGANISM="Ochromonas sp., Strain BG-1" /LENGTH=94 /DNA_ID=CAMNT_0014065999 /DNA_START=93 /DNA_END=377 /DNA_ORIENTATION=-